tara:strand:- start:2712 stop:2906 length:195 start_codon:yes stop_codon:yes gene_type:complete
MVALNKILSLQVSELPESDQIILNQISGLTKALNIKLDKLNESLDSLEINQEPKEKTNENKNER